MEGTPSQPGLVCPWCCGQVWLSGHGLVPGCPIGGAAIQSSPFPLKVHFCTMSGWTMAWASGPLSSLPMTDLQGS